MPLATVLCHSPVYEELMQVSRQLSTELSISPAPPTRPTWPPSPCVTCA